MHDVLVKAWAMWGDYLENIFVKERQLHLGVSAITCYLHACRHQNESKSRKYLAKVRPKELALTKDQSGSLQVWMKIQLLPNSCWVRIHALILHLYHSSKFLSCVSFKAEKTGLDICGIPGHLCSKTQPRIWVLGLKSSVHCGISHWTEVPADWWGICKENLLARHLLNSALLPAGTVHMFIEPVSSSRRSWWVPWLCAHYRVMSWLQAFSSFVASV